MGFISRDLASSVLHRPSMGQCPLAVIFFFFFLYGSAGYGHLVNWCHLACQAKQDLALSVLLAPPGVLPEGVKSYRLFCEFMTERGIETNIKCTELLQKWDLRASLVAQWLRICLPMQGIRVRALVWEDPTCRGATRPVSHSYWACASGDCALQQERPW